MVRPSGLYSLYRFFPCILRSPLSRHSARHCRHSTLILRHWITDTTWSCWCMSEVLSCQRIILVCIGIGSQLTLNPWIKFCQIPTQVYVWIYNFLHAHACIHVPCLAHTSAPTKMRSVNHTKSDKYVKLDYQPRQWGHDWIATPSRLASGACAR